ncbi:MAG: hypothetical protein ACRCZH_03420 [Cetobacterium sp.]
MELTREQYEIYLEMLKAGETKKKIAESFNLIGARPAEVLGRLVKKYEAALEAGKVTPELVDHHEENHTEHYTVHHTTPENVKGQNFEIMPIQKFFSNSENMEILMQMVEERKSHITPHTTLQMIPQKYIGIGNVQKSVRVNPNIYADFEKAMKKHKDLKHMTVSQLLNLALYWAMEKVSEK